MEKKILHRIELAFIIILIIALPLVLFRSSITGFVSSDTKAQVLNVTFNESQTLNLISPPGGPVYINFFSISGDVIGDGIVAVYLANKDTNAWSLVYTNIGQKKKAPLITGMAVAQGKGNLQPGTLLIEQGRKLDWPGSSGENSASGSFTAVCMDSCYLNVDDFTSKNFELRVFVEPGTIFKLQEIYYTTG